MSPFFSDCTAFFSEYPMLGTVKLEDLARRTPRITYRYKSPHNRETGLFWEQAGISTSRERLEEKESGMGIVNYIFDKYRKQQGL